MEGRNAGIFYLADSDIYQFQHYKGEQILKTKLRISLSLSFFALATCFLFWLYTAVITNATSYKDIGFSIIYSCA